MNGRNDMVEAMEKPCDCPYDGVSESHCPLCHTSGSEQELADHDCKVHI